MWFLRFIAWAASIAVLFILAQALINHITKQ
jgi:hypothetical protein